tara:strand:+ start:576 stop:1163 length:588 start_codon:yes stop_codon:yes gene_type:complete
MKKIFITIIFFSLCFISPSQADDIKDFQIGGMSLGDSLLRYFDKSEIKNNSYFLEQAKGNKEFKKYGKKISGQYDKISVTFKASDQNFTSKSIQGIKWFNDDINSCLKIRDEIIKELSNLFINQPKKDFEKRVHTFDKDSYSYDYYVIFGSGNLNYEDHVLISCYDWSKKLEYRDHLRVAIVSKEYIQWLNKLAN